MQTMAKKIMALAFAALFVVSAAGCKKSDTSSLSEEIEYVYQYEEGEEATDDGNTSESDNKTTSNKNNSTSKGNTGNTGTSGSKNTVNDGVDPSKYKGTKVIYATWRDPELNEDKNVVRDFEKKYSIDVETMRIAEGQYIDTILGKITAGNGPDVFFSTYTYPACIAALQPIEAAKFDLNEKIWDKQFINETSVNGKKFLVNTISNIWNEFDIVVYNKKIFKNNNITTPDDYVSAGKWTFDALATCMEQVANLGGSYQGGVLNYQGILGCTGENTIKLENGKFVNGYSTKLMEVIKWVATGRKEGYIGAINASDGQIQFAKGKTGILTAHAWCLKKTGGLAGMDPKDIGFVSMPSWKGQAPVQTGICRGWGICRGAKNPVGAGIFLRYYLDIDNYEVDSAFISSEAANFFLKQASSTKVNRYWVYGTGVGNITSAFDDAYTIATMDPSQVDAEYKANMSKFDSGVKALNDKMTQYANSAK